MRDLPSNVAPRCARNWALRLTACLLVLLYAAAVLGALRALAQEPTPGPPVGAAPPPVPPADLQEYVHAQFGECFQLATKRSTAIVKYAKPVESKWVYFLVNDLDGDGVEDAIIVARCKQPLGGQVDYSYKVMDPYYTKYGYGNPKITSQFQVEDPDRQNLVLVVHGAGQDAWRSTTPKSKWVFINLPFDHLGLTRVLHKKKPVVALNLLESETFSSALFWDGKKYRWEDTAGITP